MSKFEFGFNNLDKSLAESVSVFAMANGAESSEVTADSYNDGKFYVLFTAPGSELDRLAKAFRYLNDPRFARSIARQAASR